MKHQICVEAGAFARAIKNATLYAHKEDSPNNLNNVLLNVLPKLKKLAVIGCDGLGYYENRIPLAVCKNQPKPTLPGKEMRLAIGLPDAARLAKFIPSRTSGLIQLTLDENSFADGKFTVILALPDGTSTTFYSRAELELPDLGKIRARAEKGKKKNPVLQAALVPLRELARVGKVFPPTAQFAQIFTASADQGSMAFLECKNEETDISVIFMLNNLETATQEI